MGREIRKVPPNWEHPKRKRFDYRRGIEIEEFQPIFDSAFAPAMHEWYEKWQKWDSGQDPDRSGEYAHLQYWEWSSGPPDPEYYRPDWDEQEMTWFQVYETITEGTPVSPPFSTKEELAQYLAEQGDFWDQIRVKEGRREGPAGWGIENARRFVDRAWAPSMILIDGVIKEARDGA